MAATLAVFPDDVNVTGKKNRPGDYAGPGDVH
jgi:hypothetical protein